jgi:hypothetical protein
VDSIEWIEDFGKQYKTNSAAVYRKDPKIAKVHLLSFKEIERPDKERSVATDSG